MRMGRADAVAESLLELVLDGTFPVGAALPSEAELASRFGVSRLTVREAIRSLASTKVIAVQQGKSSIINPVDLWSPLDGRLLKARSRAGADPLMVPMRLLEARRVVEVAIAELAALRRDDTQIAKMKDLQEQMREAHERGDVAACVEADLAFHAVLFEAADNVFLAALFEPLESVLRSVRGQTSSVPEIREHALTRHGLILDAVSAGDSVAAREAMHAHLLQTEEDFETFLAPEVS
jgi:DNA-binding FadR family transcriptional regulator